MTSLPSWWDLFDLYLPDAAALTLLAIEGSNSETYALLLSRLTSNDDLPWEEMTERQQEKTKILQQVKNLQYRREEQREQLDTYLLENNDIKGAWMYYDIEKNAEKNLAKQHLKLLFDLLQKEGFRDRTRIQDSVNEQPEEFNRELSIAGNQLRFYGELTFMLPRFDNHEQVDEEAGYWEGKDGKIYPTHSKAQLDLVEPARPDLKELIYHLVKRRLRRGNMRRIINEFLYDVSLTVFTSFYAGMKRGVRNLPLNGPSYTRRHLKVLRQEAIERADHIKELRSDYITTITKILNTKYDQVESSEFDRIIEQLGEYRRYFTDRHLIRVIEKLNRRRRRWGNQYHRLMAKLQGIPYGVTLEEMLNHPEKFTVFGSQFVVAAEVSYHHDTTFGIVDLLVLKEIEYESKFILIPFLIIDRKTKLYEIFNFGGQEYKRRKSPKKTTRERVHPKVVHQRRQMGQDRFDRVLNSIATTGGGRYREQIEIYADHISKEIAKYNESIIDFSRIIQPISALLVNDVGMDVEELVSIEHRFLTTLLYELEDGDLHENLLQKKVVQPKPIQSTFGSYKEDEEEIYRGLGIVLLPPDDQRYLWKPAEIISEYKIDPFQYRDHSSGTRIHLHYPVTGRHHSNRHVAYLSSIHYLLKHAVSSWQDDPDILLLDLANYFAEFATEKILGLHKPDLEMAEILRDHVIVIALDYRLYDDDFYLVDQVRQRQDRVAELLDRSYDIIIITGLYLLQDFRPNQVASYRQEVLEVIRPQCDEIYIVEPPVPDAGVSKSHRIKALLPYQQLEEYQAVPNYLREVATISFNTSRIPVTAKMAHPIRDEHRLITTYFDDGSISHERISIARFENTSIWYNNPRKYWYLRNKPRERSEKEIKEVAELFPWSDYRAFGAYPSKLKTTYLHLHYDTYRLENQPILFEFDTSFDISGRIKRYRPIDTINAKRQYHRSRSQTAQVKAYSTLTPQLSDFVQTHSREPSLSLVERDLNYLSQVVELIRDPNSIEFFTKDHAESEISYMFDKNQHLVSVCDRLLEEASEDPKAHLIQIRDTLSLSRSHHKHKILNYLYRKTRFLNKDLKLGTWWDSFPLGHWLILIIRAVWNYFPQLRSWHIFQLYYKIIPWLFVEMGYSTRAPAPWIPIKGYKIIPNRIFSRVCEFAMSFLHIQTSKLSKMITPEISEIQPLICCLYPRRNLALITNLITSTHLFVKTSSGLEAGKSYKVVSDIVITNKELGSDHWTQKFLKVKIHAKYYLYRFNPDQNNWICTARLSKTPFTLSLQSEILPDIPGNYYTDSISDELVNHKVGLDQVIYTALPRLAVTENHYIFQLKWDEVIVYEKRIQDTDDLFDLIRRPKEYVEEFDSPHYIESNGEWFSWNMYDVIPVISGDQDRRLKAELHDLLDFCTHPNKRGFPFNSEEFLEIFERKITSESHHMIIKHNADRDRIPHFESDRVELDREGKTEVHMNCLYIEFDHTDIDLLRELNYALGERDSSNRFPELNSGQNYLTPYQLNHLLSIPYVISEFDGNLHRFEYSYDFPEDDPEKVLLLKEGKILVWVFRKLFPKKAGSHRTTLNSYLADKKYDYKNIGFFSNSVTYTWKYRGERYWRETYFERGDSCELFQDLLEGKRELGHYPIGQIDPNEIAYWEDVKSEIDDEIGLELELHQVDCDCLKRINS